MSTDTIHLRVGQIVPCPVAPDGVGQVEDLHYTRVTVLYLRRGRLCRARLSALRIAALMEREPLLPGMPDNFLHRAIVRRREKTFCARERRQSVA